MKYIKKEGKPERKPPLGRRRDRCEGNINIDLKEITPEGVVYVHLVQDKLQWRTVVNKSMKFTQNDFFTADRLLASRMIVLGVLNASASSLQWRN
jgi:hypothetical protein